MKMASPHPVLSPEKLQELLNGPASAPPAGVLPDFNSPYNFKKAFIATLILCIVPSTSAILLRMYTKVFLIKSIAYEDCRQTKFPLKEVDADVHRCHCYCLGEGFSTWHSSVGSNPLQIGQIAETTVSGICTQHGIGHHMYDIQLRTFFKILYV